MTTLRVEMWWPSPEALSDLIVEDAENGFTLSAPGNTECGEWLAYFNETEERLEVFQSALLSTILNHVQLIEETHGQDEKLSDGLHEDGLQTEDDFSGAQP